MHTFGDVGGQNVLNSGAGQVEYLCTLQRILCSTAEAFGKKKEENLGMPWKAIIYLVV